MISSAILRSRHKRVNLLADEVEEVAEEEAAEEEAAEEVVAETPLQMSMTPRLLLWGLLPVKLPLGEAIPIVAGIVSGKMDRRLNQIAVEVARLIKVVA